MYNWINVRILVVIRAQNSFSHLLRESTTRVIRMGLKIV